jgi:thioredoxin-like negative regulator of GroEL
MTNSIKSHKYSDTYVKNLIDRDFRINNGKVFVKQSVFKGNAGLVKFYANWCPHCNDMIEGLSFLAENLNKYDISIGAVDSDTQHKVANTLGVEALPTLFLVKKNGRLMPYHGLTDVVTLLDEIIEFSS